MLITWFVALFVSAIAARFFLPNRAIFRLGQISVASGTSILAVCNLHFPATLRAIIVANQYTFQQGVQMDGTNRVNTNCPDNVHHFHNGNIPFVTIGDREPQLSLMFSIICLLINSVTIVSDTWLAVFPLSVANIFNCSLSFIFISFPGIPPGRLLIFCSAKVERFFNYQNIIFVLRNHFCRVREISDF